MKRSSFLSSVAKHAGVPKDICEKILDAIPIVAEERLKLGEKVLLKNLVTLEVKETNERKGRNPQTNEVVVFPAGKKVKCSVSKRIKDSIKEEE